MCQGGLCQKDSSKKGKVYKTVVRPTMMQGLEAVALRKRQEADVQVTE